MADPIIMMNAKLVKTHKPALKEVLARMKVRSLLYTKVFYILNNAIHSK